MPTALEQFNASPTPANAIALAKADHLSQNHANPNWDLVDALTVAEHQARERDMLITTLRTIHANAAESADWIRMHTSAALGRNL